jgi:hypothetical protein
VPGDAELALEPLPGRRQIEKLIQAIEYQALGADASQWQENALAALRTDAGAELARAITSSSPQW